MPQIVTTSKVRLIKRDEQTGLYEVELEIVTGVMGAVRIVRLTGQQALSVINAIATGNDITVTFDIP